MKYFENLPTTTFESSIGAFDICDFFTYIDNSAIPFETSDINVDNKSTLLEASYNVYKDPNSFWTFLLANKQINPFTLLAINVNIFVQQNEDKINMLAVGNTAGTTAYTFPKGSIVLPYTSNTGGSYSYSSVGNFNLDGPLTLIESVSFYNGQMIIKNQVGSTYSFIQAFGSTGQQLTIVYPIDGGTYGIRTLLYPYDTKPATKTVVKTTVTKEGLSEESGPIYSAGSYSEESVNTGLCGGSQITAITTVEINSKNIKSYMPSDLSSLKSYFITAKYT